LNVDSAECKFGMLRVGQREKINSALSADNLLNRILIPISRAVAWRAIFTQGA